MQNKLIDVDDNDIHLKFTDNPGLFILSNLYLAIGVYLILINLITFSFFTLDKVFSMKNDNQRVKEKTLLKLMKYGGLGGGKAAMIIFRHKIKKNRFVQLSESADVVLINMVLIAFYYIFQWYITGRSK